jgi:hypothetical protein
MTLSKSLLVVPLLLLGACGTLQGIQTRVQTVYCLTPEQYKKLIQAEPEKIGHSLEPGLQEQNRQLVEQNVLVRKYSDGLLTVLGGCTGASPQPS